MAKPTPENVHDMHRQISIELLRSVSCYAVRTPRGQKDPGVIGWDPRSNSLDKSRATIDTISKTTDNLGVHLFGRVVDVDIDTDNPVMMEALDYFLPYTPHVWGRPSRLKTHRLYELSGVDEFKPSDFPFLDKIKAREDLKIEVRGGDQRSGRYSLLPGSIHPSGEAYEWDSMKQARSTPVFTDVYKLMDGVRKACVAALVVPYWQEGIRNEMCKALSGFLFRAASYSEELAIPMQLDRDAAQQLLEGILEIAEDDEQDKPSRINTFNQTWDKGEAGEPILGATHIQRITQDEEIVQLLYALLAHTADLQQLDEIFSQYAVMRNTMNILDMYARADGNYVMHKDAFVFNLQGRFIGTANGKVPISAVFLNSLQRTIVDRVSISPTKGRTYDQDGEKIGNIWNGWAIPPAEEEVTDDDVRVILEFMHDGVCQKDTDLYNWLMDWIADIFQFPESKNGTAVTLVGKPGSGKSIIGEKILRPIIGRPHSSKVSSVEKLTAKFNKHMSGKLLILGEEVMSAKRRVDADTLKDAITSDMRSIEIKGRDVFEMEDHARYLFTSNHESDAVSVESGDRRYTIIKVSREWAARGGKPRAEVEAYWKRIYGWLEKADKVPHEENLAKFHKWLLQRKYDRMKLRSAYDTDIKRQNMHSATGGLDGWLLSMLEMNNPFENIRDQEKGYDHSFIWKNDVMERTEEWPDYVPYNLLETSFRVYCRGERYNHKTSQQIAKWFKDEGLLVSTDMKRCRISGKRMKLRPMPSQQAIEDYLHQRGYDLLGESKEEWSDADEAPNVDF